MIGQSPSNLDQIIEINKGSDDGIRVGMPVVNPAGALIGKITSPVTSDRARVMLLIDTNYAVLVKIVRPEPLPSTSTSTTSTTTSPVGAAAPASGTAEHDHDDVDDDDATTSTTSTSTLPPPTTTLPDPQRETGQMVGRGVDDPPQVNLIDDSPAFGTPAVGDAVLTAGGDRSLAPADIPIGVVSDVRHGSPSEGWILEGATAGRVGGSGVRPSDPLHVGPGGRSVGVGRLTMAAFMRARPPLRLGLAPLTG